MLCARTLRDVLAVRGQRRMLEPTTLPEPQPLVLGMAMTSLQTPIPVQRDDPSSRQRNGADAPATVGSGGKDSNLRPIG